MVGSGSAYSSGPMVGSGSAYSSGPMVGSGSAYSSVKLRVIDGSTGIPGPVVVETTTFLR
jgi:hypothetical protein